jgi:hypothetical protein
MKKNFLLILALINITLNSALVKSEEIKTLNFLKDQYQDQEINNLVKDSINSNLTNLELPIDFQSKNKSNSDSNSNSKYSSIEKLVDDFVNTTNSTDVPDFLQIQNSTFDKITSITPNVKSSKDWFCKGKYYCPEGKEMSMKKCHPPCKENYVGNGPVCWQSCQENFRNDGAFCFKPKPYGRGAGYFTNNKCKSKHEQGCEKWGFLSYPICKEGYKAFGCCICTPKCMEGQTDIGISCAKGSYGRGIGTFRLCTDPNFPS